MDIPPSTPPATSPVSAPPETPPPALPQAATPPPGFPASTPAAPENPFATLSDTSHPFAATRRNQIIRTLLILVVSLAAVIGIIYYFYLRNQGGLLVLDSSKNLKVSLNDRAVQGKEQSGGLFIPASAGTYRLKIENGQYLPFIEDVQISRGQTLNIRPSYAYQNSESKSQSDSIEFVRPSLDQKAIFFLSTSRQTLYRLNVDDQTQIPLTDPVLSSVQDIQWSSQTDVALIRQPDGTYLREIPKYDFAHQILLRIGGPEMVSPIWDPTDPERIAFAYYPASGEKSLVFADKQVTKLDRKADISEIPSPKLIWSSNAAYIILIAHSSDASQNNLWVYTTADGNLKKLTNNGSVTDASFSPDGNTILYEAGGSLATIQADGSKQNSLNIPGKITRTAWRDNSSFFIPNSDNNNLSLYMLSGKRQDLTLSFTDSNTIEALFYFSSNKTLIFNTRQAVYTVNLSLP